MTISHDHVFVINEPFRATYGQIKFLFKVYIYMYVCKAEEQ